MFATFYEERGVEICRQIVTGVTKNLFGGNLLTTVLTTINKAHTYQHGVLTGVNLSLCFSTMVHFQSVPDI